MHGFEKEQNPGGTPSNEGDETAVFAPGLFLTSEFAILTRADTRAARADLPAMEAGEALIIRKANGRATDEAIESLVLSHKLLGARKWIVIHYIGDDQNPLFDRDATDRLQNHGRFELAADSETMSFRPTPGQSAEEWNAAWVGLWQAASRNLDGVVQTVREDIARIRNHPRTPADVEVEGYIRDLRLGHFSPV